MQADLTLPPVSVRDWAVKDLVSRDPLPPDLDDRQLAAAARRQLETLRTYAGHALRLYCASIDLHPSAITDADRDAAALAIAAVATDMRRDLADGVSVLTAVPLPIPCRRQLQIDEQTLHLLKFQQLTIGSDKSDKSDRPSP
jgi:hypothetical protein